MVSKISTIIKDLKSLTLLEASELVKEIEEVFGVDTSRSYAGPMSVDQVSSGTTAPEEKEQTEFSVSLETVPAPKKITILKVVRSLTGLGLIEAKKLVESSPAILKEGASQDEVDNIRKKIEDAGGTVSVK